MAIARRQLQQCGIDEAARVRGGAPGRMGVREARVGDGGIESRDCRRLEAEFHVVPGGRGLRIRPHDDRRTKRPPRRRSGRVS